MTKKILLEIGNVRIKESDRLNVEVERLETRYNKTKGEDVTSWRFKGYSRDVVSALVLICRRRLLIDENAIEGVANVLEEVEKSEQRILKALEELE